MPHSWLMIFAVVLYFAQLTCAHSSLRLCMHSCVSLQVCSYLFRIDGKSYPAKLVDLPCNVETLKTLDSTVYYKSADVGQMLVVYEVRQRASLLHVRCTQICKWIHNS